MSYFTKEEKLLVLEALSRVVVSTQRSKAKSKFADFAGLYDKILQDYAALIMKVQAMEVKK